jgi:hypothetical protein
VKSSSHSQNIDENFSKIHNVLANKILPAVKRYSIGTMPVREAAKVGASFHAHLSTLTTFGSSGLLSMNKQLKFAFLHMAITPLSTNFHPIAKKPPLPLRIRRTRRKM